MASFLPKTLDYFRNTSEVILLFIPLLLLLFPQDENFIFPKLIVYLYPLAYFWVIISKKRKISRPFATYSLAWVLFLIFTTISAIYSADRVISLVKLADYLAIFIYSSFFYLIIDTKKQLNLFLSLLISTALVLVSLSVYFQLIQPNSSLPGINLFFPNHGHNHIAAFLLISLPITIVRAITSTRKKSYILNSVLSMLFYVQLLLSFSRSAYIIIPISIILTTILFKPRPKIKLAFIAAVIIPLSFLLMVTTFSQTTSLTTSLRSSEIKSNWILRQTIKPLNQEPRLSYWNQSVQSIRENLLLGYGPGTFHLISYKYRDKVENFSYYPHSFPLQIISENGLFAFLIITSLIFYLIKQASTPTSTTCKTIFLITVNLILISLVDFDFNFVIISVVFFSLLLINTNHNQAKQPLSTKYKKLYIFASIILTLTTSLQLIPEMLFLKHCSNPDQLLSLQTFKYIPFSQSQLTTLLGNQDNDPETLQKLESNVLLFHPQSPQIHQSLAAYHYIHKDYDKFISYSETSINLDPLSVTSYQKLINYHLGQESYSKVLSIIFSSFHHRYQDLDTDIQQVKPLLPLLKRYEVTQISQADSQSETTLLLSDTDNLSSMFYARFFYLWGYQHLTSNPQLTQLLWELAAFTKPGQSHFLVELSSLYLSHGQTELFKETIDYCLKLDSSRQHCLDQQQYLQANPLLANPGSQHSLIKGNELL